MNGTGSLQDRAARIDPLFLRLRDRSFPDDCRFFCRIALAGSLLFLIATALQRGAGGWDTGSGVKAAALLMLVLAAFFVFAAVFFLVAVSLLGHLFVLVLARNPAFERTLKTVIYAAAPTILFFWLVLVLPGPFILPLFLSSFTILTVLLSRVFHGISNDRSLLVGLCTSMTIFLVLSVVHGIPFAG